MKSLLILLLVFSVHAVNGQDTTQKKLTGWQKFKATLEDDPAVVAARNRERTLPVDPETNKVSYADIVEVPKITAHELFIRAKKWIAAKNSAINPYTLTYESDEEGSVIGKGTFSLPEGRKKYVVQFVIKIGVKDGKFRYECTDFVIQLHTNAGSASGGYGGFGGTSYHDAETLEYSMETFYPSRLTSREPTIKFYEYIDKDSFATINKEMASITNSFRQTMSVKNDW